MYCCAGSWVLACQVLQLLFWFQCFSGFSVIELPVFAALLALVLEGLAAVCLAAGYFRCLAVTLVIACVWLSSHEAPCLCRLSILSSWVTKAAREPFSLRASLAGSSLVRALMSWLLEWRTSPSGPRRLLRYCQSCMLALVFLCACCNCFSHNCVSVLPSNHQLAAYSVLVAEAFVATACLRVICKLFCFCAPLYSTFLVPCSLHSWSQSRCAEN